MQFKLSAINRPSVFIPYKTHKHQYYLLFNRKVDIGTTLSVQDSKDIFLDTFFHIGDLTLDGYGGQRCGFIFYSALPILCLGTCILAYSKQWAKQVNNNSFPIKPFGVSLMLRAKHFYVYHKKNQATLIVNPNVAKHIRENLEI